MKQPREGLDVPYVYPLLRTWYPFPSDADIVVLNAGDEAAGPATRH